MNEQKTGGSAFPVTDDAADVPGMTLRDYFAAKAMQSILPQYEDVFDDKTGDDGDPTIPELLAKDAYIMADAMLKARKQ